MSLLSNHTGLRPSNVHSWFFKKQEKASKSERLLFSRQHKLPQERISKGSQSREMLENWVSSHNRRLWQTTKERDSFLGQCNLTKTQVIN
jgi:hypothetical protein